MEIESVGLINDFVLIAVRGEKALDFLQGQFTCNILSIQQNQALLGACCDHKGRMLANGWIGRFGSDFFILLPENIAPSLMAHLKKFALLSKVDLSLKDGWLALNYSGPPLLPSLPHHEFIQSQLPYKTSHYFLHWLIGPAEVIHHIQKVLASAAKVMDTNEREYATLSTRLVFIQPPTQALFIPQMIGLEKLGGVSFNKGCYVGQEIIARTQHLGQLKRHLYLGHSPHPLHIGEPLFNPQKEIIGHLAALSSDLKSGYQLLAVLQDKCLGDSIFDSQGEIIKFQNLSSHSL